MLDLLPESNRLRVRRTGGMTTSVAVHMAIIGAVTATTSHLPRRDPIPPPTVIPIQAIVERPPVSTAPRAPSNAPRLVICQCLVPLTNVPTTIPPIDLSQPATPELTRGPADFGAPGGVNFGSRIPIASSDTGTGVWNTSETLMRIITPAKPRYPEPLRGAGVAGRVTIRFIVDTTGRVEMNSVTTLQSTHALFTRAVLDVLPNLRFLPTESNGRKVRALAEMPFEFVLK